MQEAPLFAIGERCFRIRIYSKKLFFCKKIFQGVKIGTASEKVAPSATKMQETLNKDSPQTSI